MSDNMQKSIKRWLNTPTGTYPSVDKFFSRLTRLVKGNFVIKDFANDTTVSESEVTKWVSASRGSDTTGNGSFEKPYREVQKALDDLAVTVGNDKQKNILIESGIHSYGDPAADFYFKPFFCNLRHILIKGIGHKAYFYPMGTDPACIITNMTRTSFDAFLVDGGMDYTDSGNYSITWTGGSLAGRETAWEAGNRFKANVTLENLNINGKYLDVGSYGPMCPSLGLVFTGPLGATSFRASGITLIDCIISDTGTLGQLRPSIIANNFNLVDSYSVNTRTGASLEINCQTSLNSAMIDTGYNGDYSNATVAWPKIFLSSSGNIAGVSNAVGGLYHNVRFGGGLVWRNTGGTTVLSGFINSTGNAGFIDVSGPFTIKDVDFTSSLNLTINNTIGTQGMCTIHCYGNFVQTAGSLYSRSGEVAGNCTINGGTFKADGLTIRGNLVVADGVTIDLLNVTVLGTVTLGATSVVTRWKGGSFYGTLTDNGTHAFPAAGTLMNK
jgi:hypothetical protein